MSDDSENDAGDLITGIEEGKQELLEMIESSEDNTEEIKSEVEAMAKIAITMTRAHSDLKTKMTNLTEQLERQTEEGREQMEEFAETLLGDSTDEIAARLLEAKNKIEKGESEEAQQILQKTREEIEDGKYDHKGYSSQVFISRLRMAESDAKLSRTNVLEDLLSEVEVEADQGIERVRDTLETTEKEWNEGLPDDPKDLTEHGS